MKRTANKLLLIFFCAAQAATAIAQVGRPAPEAFTRGMVSLSFDDGRLSAFTQAFYYLDRAGVKGTFYITTQNLNKKGFMTESQILKINSRGHDIGSHTRTHPYLTCLPENEIWDEIVLSKMELRAMGIESIATFAYPFDDYNADTEKFVRGAGYTGARACAKGFNTKSTDPYSLKAYSVEASVTVADIEKLIDQGERDKTWLILLFHLIDESGTRYAVPPENLEKILRYLSHKNISVVTVSQGITKLSK